MISLKTLLNVYLRVILLRFLFTKFVSKGMALNHFNCLILLKDRKIQSLDLISEFSNFQLAINFQLASWLGID